jgi:hypothetical protein
VPAQTIPSPKTGRELVDDFFIETRNRIVEVAAFLDRLDRAGGDPVSDFRVRALNEALRVLVEGEYPRVQAIQTLFSDPTEEPLAALDQKSARGAYDRWTEQG